MSIFQIVGVFGFFVYIASFALLQLRMIDGNSNLYSLLNIVGASLVLLSLMEAFNLASMLIQVSWIFIGIAGICMRYRRQFTESRPRIRAK